MKKIKFLPLFFLTMAFVVISSCTKEGPAGPTGATGATGATGNVGPTGPTGATGTANVIYSSWAAISTMGTVADSTFTDYGTCKKWYRTAPGLTNPILDSGLVLSYWRVSTNIYSVLPYLFPVGAQTYFLNSIPKVGKIIYFTSIFGAGAGWVPNSSAELRYILIPGGVGGGRSAGFGGTGFTADEIKAMPYEQVRGLFNIPADGEGWH
ncbi:MAG: hypothetical protein WBO30_03020 [Ferruginibacter sp.]